MKDKPSPFKNGGLFRRAKPKQFGGNKMVKAVHYWGGAFAGLMGGPALWERKALRPPMEVK